MNETEVLDRNLEEARIALAKCMGFQEVFTAISTALINLPVDRIDDGINEELGRVGRFLAVDRVYVFLFNDQGSAIQATFEWCAEGVEHHPFEELHDLPVTTFPWTMEHLEAGKTIHVEDPAQIPAEAEPERGACEAFSIKSYVNIPLVATGKLRGWAGLDSVGSAMTWGDTDVAITRMVGELVINAVMRAYQDREREGLLAKLQGAMGELKTLKGLLPICAMCKKIRDDEGAWHPIELYIRDHSQAQFTHGYCPECVEKHFPEVETD